MNRGQKDLERILDDLDNMTAEEYEELYERAMKWKESIERKGIRLIGIEEEVDIGESRFRVYAKHSYRYSYRVYSPTHVEGFKEERDSKGLKDMYQKLTDVLNTNEEKIVMAKPLEESKSIRFESYIKQDDSSLLAA